MRYARHVKVRTLAVRAVARRGATLVAVAALLMLGCAGRAELIRGDLTAKDLDGLVDSDPARRLLTDLLARRAHDPRLEATGRAPSWRMSSGSGRRALAQTRVRFLTRRGFANCRARPRWTSRPSPLPAR
jgi:hypothetical protein